MIEKIQKQIRDRINALRAIERILNNPEFVECYNNSNCIEQMEVLRFVNEQSRYLLNEWIKRHREPSIKLLRDMARSHGVKNYSHMTKEELLRALND